MKKHLAVLALGCTAVATPALAQDNSTFTGPRVEAILGYDKTQAGSSVDNDTTSSDDQSVDGLLYGIGAGYDVAVGGVVLGVEGEYTDSTAKTGYDNGDFEGFGFGNVKVGRDLYVGARAGVLTSPRTMVYAKAGYTNARFDVLASDGTTELKNNFDTDGWRVGAGVEHALGPQTFAKLEYRYSNYNKGEVDYPVGTDSARFDIDTDRHQVVVGVGMRF
ncbi:outer membrane protein [Novosphingobium tardum]|uniref:Outer membrane protein n=1 Tax=Novosphingobium tardum TaxID=1538021 RepID=A0ABV8RTN5_9SPHN